MEDAAALATWSLGVASLRDQRANEMSYQFALRRLWAVVSPFSSSISDPADRVAGLLAFKMMESKSRSEILASEQKYEELMRRHPNDVVYRENFGVAEDRLGRLDWEDRDSARRHYETEKNRLEEARRFEPDNAGIERNIGSTLINLGLLDEGTRRVADWEQALQHDLKALQLKPDFSAALSDATKAELQLERPREAVRLCRTVLLLQQSSSEGMSAPKIEYGIALAAAGNIAEAVKLAEGDPSAFAGIGKEALSQGYKDVASDLLSYAKARWTKAPAVIDLEKAVTKTNKADGSDSRQNSTEDGGRLERAAKK